MSSDPVPISGLIDSMLGRLARADIAPVVRLRMEWHDVAGAWADRCRPVALGDGVLTLVVVSGLEATRLRYDAASLIERVNEFLGPANQVAAVSVRVAAPTEKPTGGAGPSGRR